MGLINEIKIELQRWIFRKRRQSFKINDDKAMLAAIERAEQFTARRGNRLWVVKISPGDYRVYTKGQVKTFFRSLKHLLPENINIYNTSEYIVHITKKPL